MNANKTYGAYKKRIKLFIFMFIASWKYPYLLMLTGIL